MEIKNSKSKEIEKEQVSKKQSKKSNVKKTKTVDKDINKEKLKVPKTKEGKQKTKYVRLIAIIIFLIIILITLILLATNKNDSKNKENSINNNIDKNEQKDKINQEEKLEVYNIDSNERPYAVMISNDGVAKKRQYGIQKAYLVYEITVEGGITRLMALYKDSTSSKIGPVRSSRHYYLDYALENDAIYVHYGWSTYAQNDIPKLNINNLNGLYNPSNMFWRDENYSSPNNAYTSTENIKKAIEDKDYRTTSEDYELLNYKKEIDLSKDETYKDANNIVVNYSGGAYVKYVYDEEHKYYLRYNNENKHMDLETNEQVHVKNILVLKMDTETIANDEYGRQNLYNIGSGQGYYISNGQSIEITWQKEKRDSKTIYKNSKGEIIDVNDGNTYIQIQPTNKTLTIE